MRCIELILQLLFLHVLASFYLFDQNIIPLRLYFFLSKDVGDLLVNRIWFQVVLKRFDMLGLHLNYCLIILFLVLSITLLLRPV